MNVTLEWYELSRAALVGVSRNVEALRMKCHDRLSTKASNWDIHILGALGECALCKALGLYWAGGINTFKAGDVGDLLQVRTRSNHAYEMIVRRGDKDTDIFTLVTGGPAEFRVVGWLTGKDAKRKEWLKNYGGYGEEYFVPQSALRPMADLPKITVGNKEEW